MTSAAKKCIIRTLGYSVEEAYCRPESDFARVVSSGSDREEFSPDEGFHIRQGSFSYGQKEPAYMDGMCVVQLIRMFSFPLGLLHNSMGDNCFTEVIQN